MNIPTQRHSGPRRTGQAMLELALLIPIIVIIIGGTISLGLFFFQANVLQQAVDVGAQEIARMPFPPDQELGLGRFDLCTGADYVCDNERFKEQIYDEKFLVIPDSQWGSGTPYNGDFQSFCASELPLLNRLMVPAMVRDNRLGVTKYPGAMVNISTGADPNFPFTVLIPLVQYGAASTQTDDTKFPSSVRSASETIVRWVKPVEEILADHDGDANTPSEGPFKLSYDSAPADDGNFQPGMVALRINYPAQSTGLLNRVDGGIVVVTGSVNDASGQNLSQCYSMLDTTQDNPLGLGDTDEQDGSEPNGGEFGLGELEVLTRTVRPYRTVMSFQAIYRREVFE